MAFPPTIPLNTRTNSTPQINAHVADHNSTANALTDIVARLTAVQATDATLAAPWAGLAKIRTVAGVTTLTLLASRNAVTLNGPFNIGSVPLGSRPTGPASVYVTGAWNTTTLGTAIAQSCLIKVGIDGVISAESRVDACVQIGFSIVYVSV